MSAASELEKIAREVAVCTKCDLCKHRTNTVPGEGSPHARVMFIGEAPGFHEDQQGRPFVGQSGQLLNKLLEAVNLPREQVFIANVVKCHPPQNLDPTPEQMAACKPYLDRQIAAINPRLIVTLGRFSMARYWPGQYISQIHGQVKQADGRLYLPMFHPSAALRDRERTLPRFKADGLQIPVLLARAEEMARSEIWGYPTGEEAEAEPAPVVPAVAPKTVEPPGQQTPVPASPVTQAPLPAVVKPLAVAETPAPFETKSQAGELQGENDQSAPFVAPVADTLKAEEAAPEVVAAVAEPAPVPDANLTQAGEVVEAKAVYVSKDALPGVENGSGGVNGVEAEDAKVLATQTEVAPGLSLAEAGKVRKQPNEPAKPRKKRPAGPGEQLSMF